MDFFKAMRAEHCSKAGSRELFTTPNYNITTSPENEWRVIVERVPCESSHMNHGRVIPDPNILCKSSEALRANLKDVEVIAVILYTGPMVSAPQQKMTDLILIQNFEFWKYSTLNIPMLYPDIKLCFGSI